MTINKKDINIYMYVCMYACMYVYIYTCVYVCIYNVHIYIYINSRCEGLKGLCRTFLANEVFTFKHFFARLKI